MRSEEAAPVLPQGSTTGEQEEAEALDEETIDDVCGDILREIYYYVLRERTVLPDKLNIGHVVATLKEEGILFWRDERYKDCQDVALEIAKQSRSKFTDKISNKVQELCELIPIDYETFVRFISPGARLFLRSFSEENVIPDWSTFCTDIAYHYYAIEPIKEGQNAQYIPILQKADPEKFGLAVCSTDGQRFSIGDAKASFSLQSVSKPVTYALGLEKEGHDYLDEWIGVEPAGRPFNTQDLDDRNRPFNSAVNSGAIMASAVYASGFPDQTWREVVDKVRGKWYTLCGNDWEIGFSDRTYESEKATAYNNFAITYNLKGRRGMPRNVDLHKALDVYLGCCSIEITCEALSVAAATFANGGVCPITGKEVFPAHVTRTVLSEIMTCGMYDQAGRFAVEVGIPSKSGVSGALMVIVPNVFGFATFSPRLNKNGNSVRGYEFCKRLVASYRVHIFEPLRSGNTGAKVDPRKNNSKRERSEISRMAWAVQVGDRYALRLRDIFLFCLCQTAAASPQGLSDNMLNLIRKNYEKVYHADVDGKYFQEIVDVVREHPNSFKFLEELACGVYVVDSHRSLILLSLIDILIMDGKVDAVEKDVAVRVAGLLGVDKSVAFMEIDRYEKDIATYRRLKSHNVSHTMSEIIDTDISYNRMLGKGYGLTGGNEDQSSNHDSMREVVDLLCDTSHDQGETLHLRREIYRLRRKVAQLSSLLENRSETKPEK